MTSRVGGAAEPLVVWQEQGRTVGRALAPWWLTQVVLSLAWFYAVLNRDPGESVQCRDNPAACTDWGVDTALATGSLFAVPFLLWIAPRAGLLLGGLWGVLFLVFSFDAGEDLSIGLHGLACCAVLAVVQNDRYRRQAAIRPDIPAAAVAGPRPHLRMPAAFWIIPTAVTTVLLVFAALFAALYIWASQARDDWFERSVVVDARVTALDEFGDLVLEHTDGTTWNIDAQDTYRVGDPARVRYDPQDPDAAELEAEPSKFGGFLAATGWLLTLAAAVIWRLAGQRRFLGRLRRGGLPEYSVLAGLRSRYVYLHGHPAQGQAPSRPFAMLPTRSASSPAEPLRTAPLYGEPEEPLQPVLLLSSAVFVGEPLPGRWGVVVADDVVRWARKPLQEVHRAPWNRSDQPIHTLSQARWRLPTQSAS
ncbi:DUF3592 domain-containing protein [Kineosporia sp. NBRC 101677]|uniref:DUF3592 domain-containing protein n=1 Tax=Kineosporia sp. NBRC 101677 TaxID=3032197 RepID=UPI002553E383|nr:DUF3592 domain-containing protein [Kineosporia sp. NBRC 101677]